MAASRMELSSDWHISLVNVDDNAMQSIKNEIVEILQLNDDDNQDSIVLDLLNNGRQALAKYEQDIIPEIYAEVMKNDDNALMTSLKMFFQQHWETQYGSSHQWFISFLKEYEFGENVDVYQRVLNRTAEYGNGFIKHCPHLSIVVQLLFEGIGDEELLEAKIFDDRYLNESDIHNTKCLEEINACDELWFSITNDGLTSITKHPEYIVEDVMKQQLNKTQSTLFQALCVYYRPQLFSLLETHKIANRGNLHDSLLENVAEHGWLTGLTTIQKKITPRSYSNLSTSMNSIVEQRKAQKQKVQHQSVRKSEDKAHLETNDATSNNIPSESSNANLTTASSKESELSTQLSQTKINQSETSMLTQSSTSIGQTQASTISTTETSVYATQSIDKDEGTVKRSEKASGVMFDEKEKKKMYLANLSEDLATVPCCAEKTAMEILLNYEKKLLGYTLATYEENNVDSLLQKLQDQVKKEELLSAQIMTYLQDLNRSVRSDDSSSVVGILGKLLKSIRPLNIHEIKRLLDLTDKTAKLIVDKDIVLLLGSTGAGKSTTIHFLAGSKMQEIKVEVSPGHFLHHIAAVELAKNCDLTRVTTSPWSVSETRYIWPVTIPMKDILGSHITGEITLCDAPGFGDTSGPEVDIANGLGVIKALSGCKSVKILALSSYVNLGDKGQGIQELAHILSKMIKDIEDNLGSIFYAFTKYPPEKNDIHARLLDIKQKKVAEDPLLSHDTSLVTVLDDMIEKTKQGGFKIDPVNGSPRELIEKMKRLNFIQYPGEIFRFSMSEDTKADSNNYVQQCQLSVICAMKNKNIDLLVYYLNNLKALKGWIEESFIHDAYEKSTRSISENIEEYCKEVIRKFNRALESQDGLREEDISEYKKSVEYIESIQKPLDEHFKSGVSKPESLIHNIDRQLQKRYRVLEETDLQSHLVEVYLGNLYMLKDSFPEFEVTYSKNCKDFEDRFNKLLKSANELIGNNEFDKVAEIIRIIFKSSCVLKRYLREQVEEKYHAVIKSLLKYLSGFVEKAEPLLGKIRLNDDDVKDLKSYLDILRSAKETPMLQECLSTYMKTLKIGLDTVNKSFKSLNEIYNEFIEKIVNYFDEINVRVKELFEKSGDYALESIEKLVSDMGSIRTIPEIEAKTSGSYYRTVENVRGYMQQLQRDAEQLIVDIEQKTGSITYGHLARSLSRLRNAEWINRASPGAYDALMHRIKEELIENARKLEEQLKRLDFHLKHPENVGVAQAIVEKIESMSILESSVPELENYRVRIQNKFRETTQAAFDSIQKTFNLQDRDVYNLKQQLKGLEKIKKEYENLHPAQKYLLKHQYLNADQLNDEIENVNKKLKEETDKEEALKLEKEEKVNMLQDIVDRCVNLSRQGSNQSTMRVLYDKVTKTSQREKLEPDNYLKEHGFTKLDDVYEAKLNTRKDYDKKLQLIRESYKGLNDTLNRLEQIRQEHKSLLLVRSDSFSLEGMQYLREKEQNSIESIEAEIQEKKVKISEREKNKQKYDFSGRFDGSMANTALVYIVQCEKVGDSRIKEIATETNEILHKYFGEYGYFLKQEMVRLYQNGKKSDAEGGPLQYCYELCIRLEELSSLENFPDVFKCVKGAEQLVHWRQEIVACYNTFNDLMEEHDKPGERELLRKHLSVFHGFICLDRFLGHTQFYDLYRKLREWMSDDLNVAYRELLKHICNSDYVRAGNVLSNIGDRSLNTKTEKQIELELQSSLVKLMRDIKCSAQWLYGKIEREEENKKKIEEIVANLEKIQNILTQFNLMKLLDEKTKSDLENFQAEIDQILSDIILQELSSIETYMNTDHFAQAEEGIEKITNVVQHHLKSIVTSQEVIKKTQELRKKLNDLATNISTQIDFSNIEKYFEKPPKDLLANLRLVSTNRLQYKQAYTALLGKLRLDFNKNIEEVGSLPMRERPAKLRSLNHALCYIPDELQAPFKAHIEEMTDAFRNKEKDYEHELSKSLKVEQENEQTFMKISELAKNFQEQKMDELAEKMNEGVLKKLQDYRIHLQNSLDEFDMQSALTHMDKIIKYKDFVSSYISGIKEVYETSRTLTINSFENCSKILAEISKIEKSETVEKAFNSTIACINFSNNVRTSKENFLPKTALQKYEKDLELMRDYLQNNSEKYRYALKNMVIDDLHSTIVISKRWQNLLQLVKDCILKDDSTKSLIPDVQNVVTHNDMISEVTKEISCLKAQLNVELISDETTKFEGKREEFFRKLRNSLNKLKEIDERLQDVLLIPVNAKESEENLKKKAKRIGHTLLETASKPQLTQIECDQFRKYYQHLLAIGKHLSLPDVEAKENLDTSQIKVLEKVASLHREFIASDTNLEKAADRLIEIKSLAENLPMFATGINEEIDRSLTVYREKYRPASVRKLTMKLQTSDVGFRMMSEHAILKGEDWRYRDEKTKVQNNPEYILNLLEGDDLDKNVLSSRYDTFKTAYDDILLRNVGFSDEKSNLDALVSNTRCFVDSLTRNSKSNVMSKSFRNRVPELLAHIFAIWTLQNTEYYNSMRGTESEDAYLLRPHVAQIIAVFRILGIGYKTSNKSENLFNNLVQIGTGEGKSVVMASIACVFALAGVDVNCSCYSSALSRRDKEAFASLFRVLGIEGRIDYGTFDKLCENLLNEQCNVREKVCDMILKNKSVLEVVEVKERLCQKVLLIDEVDVFLSDQYYGGVYTPVVYLKHPLVKALLDTIWENKTIRTLNGIKALPAYTTCAGAFSNWTFLLDEAVKDMIAALKSYESSTYLVQDDKIVYVEGESIVENVVRGYDTVWAYYHENRKGEISSSSLEANVGIIINCGAFSFAEMPHDFAYITGVTGTLKTLAEAEKEILVKVYKVQKNTYMPSVFGSCRRIYNCETDVRVVNETEYFMEIRQDIDQVLRAKRAILVFFESEEKLKKFYHSSQLSSIKPDVQIMTETVDVKEREICIRRSGAIEKVTLLTRTFGRGTDFICNNQQILANGGIHVLQTFFSEELSEEYQIMGRGARQGDLGSYRMILLDKDLEWILGASWTTELPKLAGRPLYENLNKARNHIFQSKCNSKGVGIAQRKKEHDASKNFMVALNRGDIVTVKEFLQKQNQGANIATALSRTMLLMDATGSMSSLLSAVKETVCTMFERAGDVLKEKGLPSDAFQMQFVIYRDYDCKEEGILQSSSWETKPNNLRNFITPIAAIGGGDYEEAIEVGLWYAVQQSEQPDGLSQVILIGDAPAKEKPAIARDRNASGGEVYWSKTKYKTPTYYADELSKLRAKNISVHTFYLADGAQSNFKNIATPTVGRCERLDIYSPQGTESLTHCVTEEILRKAAGDQGNAAVELYRRKYVKGYMS